MRTACAQTRLRQDGCNRCDYWASRWGLHSDSLIFLTVCIWCLSLFHVKNKVLVVFLWLNLSRILIYFSIYSESGTLIGCVSPDGAPRLLSGMGTGKNKHRDGEQSRGAGEIWTTGDGDGVLLPGGDVPIAILNWAPCPSMATITMDKLDLHTHHAWCSTSRSSSHITRRP